MAEWKGVPYFFDASGLHAPLSVIVEKMPTVLIEPPFAWEMMLGIGASTIVSICALISNFKLARMQNNHAVNKEKASAFLIAIATYITNANLAVQRCIMYSRNLSTCTEHDRSYFISEINSVIKEFNYEHATIKLLLDDGGEYSENMLGKLSDIVNDLNKLKEKTLDGSVFVQSEGDEIHKEIEKLIILSREFRANLLNRK